MKNRQQKQIRMFLAETFGQEQGGRLFARQEEMLGTLLENNRQGRPQSQQWALAGQILPCIALYKTLLDSGFTQEDAYGKVRLYLLEKVAAGQHASMARMEWVPGFYSIYSAAFRQVMRIADLWVSTQRHDRDSFDITIRKCLWHTACAENSCPELCRLFCEADNVTYGGLKKIGFARTGTLGLGSSCCDFHFFRK